LPLKKKVNGKTRGKKKKRRPLKEKKGGGKTRVWGEKVWLCLVLGKELAAGGEQSISKKKGAAVEKKNRVCNTRLKVSPLGKKKKEPMKKRGGGLGFVVWGNNIIGEEKKRVFPLKEKGENFACQ